MATASAARPGLGIYGGLFFTTLSTLMYELLLTRIFSVTMWYHFAFVAVSVALFGMTVGALAVHLLPGRFPEARTKERLVQASLLFSVSIVISFVLHLQIPFRPGWSAGELLLVMLTYLIIAVPFTFSGITVCLALTRFPAQVGRLYSADLVGAGLGTITLIWLLDRLQDGPSTVLAVAALSAVGACWFALSAARQPAVLAALGCALLLGGMALGNAVSVQQHHPILRVRWVKGEAEGGVPLYERWNSFSRIRIDGNPDAVVEPLSLGFGSTYRPGAQVRQLSLSIDATAGATLTGYDGDVEKLGYLRQDVTNLVHYLRPDARVAIIGVGGGRDVLAALAFGQPSITAVEMNGAILNAVNGRFGEFTGHLDRQPGVRFVSDEGRSFIARSSGRFDIIHVPFTDTWAATGAGAFALSENGLYTVDAWQTFLEHLTDGGILSVNRWHYFPRPMESYRLVSLAVEALRRLGVERPRDHIIFVTSYGPNPQVDVAVGNILVSRTPFSASDVSTFRQVITDLQFHVLIAPGWRETDRTIAAIAEADDPGSVSLGFPGDISAPTDNRPFFFQMVSFRDLFDRSLYGGVNDYLAKPVLVLFSLMVAVLVLTGMFIVGPLLLTTNPKTLARTAPYIAFFGAIGLAFILVEISQLQRLIIFLGHPTYALSVVLFSLLVSSGIGSLATERLVRPNPRLALRHVWPVAALLAVLLAFGLFTPLATEQFDAERTPVRILTAVGLLAPMGFFMGMPFPLGMKAAALEPNAPTAFFWGVNGATSVCASVLAVAIALGWGISASFWAGFVAYGLALAALGLVALRRPA